MPARGGAEFDIDRVLGYEAVGLDGLYYFHSWRCFYDEQSLSGVKGLQLQGNGLFGSFSEAMSCAMSIEMDRQLVNEPWFVLCYSRGRSI
ncbi:hypothetical protein GCM10009599_27690 [Luteococcus peritonei]